MPSKNAGLGLMARGWSAGKNQRLTVHLFAPSARANVP